MQVKKIQVVQLFGQVSNFAFKMGNLFPKLGDLEKTTQVSHLLRSAILRSECVCSDRLQLVLASQAHSSNRLHLITQYWQSKNVLSLHWEKQIYNFLPQQLTIELDNKTSTLSFGTYSISLLKIERTRPSPSAAKHLASN